MDSGIAVEARRGAAFVGQITNAQARPCFQPMALPLEAEPRMNANAISRENTCGNGPDTLAADGHRSAPLILQTQSEPQRTTKTRIARDFSQVSNRQASNAILAPSEAKMAARSCRG